MVHFKKGIIFFYVSLIVHFYLGFFVFFALDASFKNALENIFRRQSKNQETMIENIIVETQTTSKQKPLKGKISDKMNPDSGKKGSKNTYNYFNPNPNDHMSEPSVPKKEDLQKNENGEGLPKPDTNQFKQHAPSDYHTSYYDPVLPVEVEMNSLGDLSLGTIPTEFAKYFLAMQKKIGESWSLFFPVFQHYQGILKSGDVVIYFEVDPDGNVQNTALAKSYGYSVLDQSCLNAVRYSRNFGPLPKGLRGKGKIPIRFKFVYIGRN
jgi:TonB family protein